MISTEVKCAVIISSVENPKKLKMHFGPSFINLFYNTFLLWDIWLRWKKRRYYTLIKFVQEVWKDCYCTKANVRENPNQFDHQIIELKTIWHQIITI